MNITEFLLARIAEDEAVARAAQQGHWYMGQHPDYGFDEGIWVDTGDVHEIVCIRDVGWNSLTNDVMVVGEHVVPLGPSKDWQDGPHIARHDPARVLAECAAKQWTLDTLRSYEPDTEWEIEPDMGKRLNNAAGAVRQMAVVYKYHPDYDPEWSIRDTLSEQP